jgi:hypothetical protein
MSLVLTGNFSLDTGENLTSVILRIESFRIERYTGYLITVPIFYKNSIDASQWNPNININKNMFLDGNTFEPPDHYTIKMTIPEISGDLIRNKIDISIIGNNPLSWAYSRLKDMLREVPGVVDIFDN